MALPAPLETARAGPGRSARRAGWGRGEDPSPGRWVLGLQRGVREELSGALLPVSRRAGPRATVRSYPGKGLNELGRTLLPLRRRSLKPGVLEWPLGLRLGAGPSGAPHSLAAAF